MTFVKALARSLGIKPRRILRSFPAMVWYLRSRRRFRTLAVEARLSMPLCAAPVLHDRYAAGGVAKGHYFHQDLLVARRIHERKPRRHIDFGSRVDGFVAHVAAFRRIEFYDYRPVHEVIPNMVFRQADITRLDAETVGLADSVSSLHVVEHIGLGRYGDDLNPRGHEEAIEALKNVVEPGGILYLSLPIGKERVEFNAHRVFDPRTIIELTRPDMDLERFSFVDDNGRLHENVFQTDGGEDWDTLSQLDYGCGIFELRKIT